MSKTSGKVRTRYRHNLPVLTRCAYCGKPRQYVRKLKRCEGCKIARYCDNECQTMHWNGRAIFFDGGSVRAHRYFCMNVYDRTPVECPTRAERRKTKTRAEKMVSASIVEHLHRVDVNFPPVSPVSPVSSFSPASPRPEDYLDTPPSDGGSISPIPWSYSD
jgi:hypothetical protein